jgi:hypothetical protein
MEGSTFKKKKRRKDGEKSGGNNLSPTGTNNGEPFEGISETDEDELMDEESLIESSDFDGDSRRSGASKRRDGYDEYNYSSFRGGSSRRNLEKGKTDFDVLKEVGGSFKRPK